MVIQRAWRRLHAKIELKKKLVYYYDGLVFVFILKYADEKGCSCGINSGMVCVLKLSNHYKLS